MLYIENSLDMLIKCKKNMVDLGLLYYFIGMKIIQDINKSF